MTFECTLYLQSITALRVSTVLNSHFTVSKPGNVSVGAFNVTITRFLMHSMQIRLSANNIKSNVIIQTAAPCLCILYIFGMDAPGRTLPPTCWFRAQKHTRWSGGWATVVHAVQRLVDTEIRSNNTRSDWLYGLPRGVACKRFAKGFIVSLLSGAEIVCYPFSSTIK